MLVSADCDPPVRVVSEADLELACGKEIPDQILVVHAADVLLD